MEKSKEMCAVINTGNKEYREVFKGKEYAIPSGKYIKLPRREALEFVGNCPGADPVTGTMIPKPLKVHRGENVTAADLPVSFVSPFTGATFSSEAELKAHVDLYQEEHPEAVTEAEKPNTGKTGDLHDPQMGELQGGGDTSGLLECPICKLKVRGKHGLQIHLKSCRE